MDVDEPSTTSTGFPGVETASLGPPPVPCNLKYVEEKPVGVPLVLLEWSPRMDLIAVATKTGESLLYRLNWIKIWSRAPPDPASRVTALVWRPDGRIVGFGHSSGDIMLREIEHGDTVHYLSLGTEITFLRWIALPETEEEGEFAKHLAAIEDSEEFLPDLPPLSKCYGMAKGMLEERGGDQKRVLDQRALSMLVACSAPTAVRLYAFGVFLCGELKVDVGDGLGDGVGCRAVVVRGAAISEDFRRLVVVVGSEGDCGSGPDCVLRVYDTSYIRENEEEIVFVAKICAQLGSLMQYSTRCMQGVREAVEHLSLEFESKLSPLKAHLGLDAPAGDDARYEILAQFAELETFGFFGLDKDFVHGLSTRGLRKLRASLDQGYTNVLSLVTEHLVSAGHAIVYHATRLRGLTRCAHRFAFLGLEEPAAVDCLRSAEQFLLKTHEFQTVLMRHFAPFREEKQKGTDHLAGNEGSEISREETHPLMWFIAEMLRPLVEVDEETLKLVKDSSIPLFEPVGQYAKDAPMTFPRKMDEHPWAKFVESLPLPKDEHGNKDYIEGNLFVPDPRLSLQSAHRICVDMVQACIENRSAFTEVTSLKQPMHVRTGFGPSLTVRAGGGTTLLKSVPSVTSSSSAEDDAGDDGTAASAVGDVVLLQLEKGTDEPRLVRAAFAVANGDGDGDVEPTAVTVNDADFYTASCLSVLLNVGSSSAPLFLQAPVKDLEAEMRPPTVREGSSAGSDEVQLRHVCFTVARGHTRPLEDVAGGGGTTFAVSGSRKVAAVVFKDRLRVRVVETEYEEEEEEEAAEGDEEENGGGGGGEKEGEEMEASAGDDGQDATLVVGVEGKKKEEKEEAEEAEGDEKEGDSGEVADETNGAMGEIDQMEDEEDLPPAAAVE